MRPEYFFSLRYLVSPRADKSISVITLISIIGVALGVTALIVVLSVMNGFERDIRDALVGANAHVTVGKLNFSGESGFVRDEEVDEKIAQVTKYEYASPFIISQALVTSSYTTKGALIRGVDPKKEELNEKFLGYIRKNPDKLSDQAEAKEILAGLPASDYLISEDGIQSEKTYSGIILGSALARDLNVRVGETIRLITLEQKITPFGSLPKTDDLVVQGVFKSGLAGYDEVLAIVDIKYAGKLFNMKDRISGISIFIDDPEKAEDYRAELQEIFQFPFYVRSWISDNANLFVVILLEKIALAVILGLVILIAAFNIIGSQIMTVIEKRHDIAILKTMGARDGLIRKIFMYQGMVIGSIGTFFGLATGLAVCYVLGNYNIIEIPDGVYVQNKIPMYVDYTHVALIILASFLICSVVSLYPSSKAARLNPAESFRID